MITALAFFSLGATEMTILLVIILILFGGARLPKLMQGMQQGIHSFKSGMQQDELWQFTDGRQRQISQPPKPEPRQLGFTFILGAALLLIMAASIAGVISVTQALAALGVIAVVGLTWWLLFGRTRH
jgi:sec-independent protein translocase protein TatA